MNHKRPTKAEIMKDNFEARKSAEEIILSGKTPSDEEREILKKFRGWGGVPELFDRRDGQERRYASEKKELQEWSREEIIQAEENTLSGFYTPDWLAKIIDDKMVASGCGVRNGGEVPKFLDLAAGIGSFVENGQILELIGEWILCEKDPLTARILSLLHPEAEVYVGGFETFHIEDNSMDGVFLNPPFGDFSVSEPRYNHLNLKIHDHCILKGFRALKPGGVMAVITSVFTMDKKNDRLRRTIAEENGVLRGAIRLPSGTFETTDVQSDLLFIQKDVAPDENQSFIHSDGNLNDYFRQNPKMILHEEDIEEALIKAMDLIDFRFHLEEEMRISLSDKGVRLSLPAEAGEENGTYTLREDEIFYVENGEAVQQTFPKATKEKMKAFIKLLDLSNRLIYMMGQTNANEEKMEILRKELNDVYDTVSKKYGVINSRSNRKILLEDVRIAQLLSLEVKNPETGEWGKSDIFRERTIFPSTLPSSAGSVEEALGLSITIRGKVDLEYMERLLERSQSDIQEELLQKRLVFPDHKIMGNTGKIDPEHLIYRSDYLSGKVRKKYREVMEILNLPLSENNRKILTASAEELKDRFPEDIPKEDILMNLSSSWIPPEIKGDFLRWAVLYDHAYESGTPCPFVVRKTPYTKYKVESFSNRGVSFSKRSNYETERADIERVVESALNGALITVKKKVVMPDGKEKSVINEAQTDLANKAIERLNADFMKYLGERPDVWEKLAEGYNFIFNGMALKDFDGSRRIFDGMNPKITLTKDQRDSIERAVTDGSCCIALPVGYGKTFVSIATMMTLKSQGLISKACMVVPKHLIASTCQEIRRLYPGAKFIAPEVNEFTAQERQKFLARIPLMNFDIAVMSNEQFRKIPLSDELRQANLEKEIESIRSFLDTNYLERSTVKELQKRMNQLTAKLNKIKDKVSEKCDDLIPSFEKMGFDFLCVDEAHYYKNLAVVTSLSNVGGINTSTSERAFDMKMKCDYIMTLHRQRSHNPEQEFGVLFMTGTPVSNSMVELYVLQSMIRPLSLKEYGFNCFDDWRQTFAQVVCKEEIKPEGNGYQLKERLSRFINVPEIKLMSSTFIERGSINGTKMDLPEVERLTVTVKSCAETQFMMDELSRRGDRIRSGAVDRRKDNILCLIGSGRAGSLDVRLFDNTMQPADSKIDRCVENVLNEYIEGQDEKKAQVIFCDLATPGGELEKSFSVYNYIKNELVRSGVIPEEEIAFIHEAKTKPQCQEMFAKVNSGQIRVLIGSTGKCGVGSNFQERLVALHHLDPPYRPSDLEQREGRIIRQGNRNKNVRIYTYVSEGTLDAFSWQIIQTKSSFIQQITQKGVALTRSIDDMDEVTMSYADLKAAAAGDTRIKERMLLENKRDRLIAMKMAQINESESNKFILSRYKLDLADAVETKAKVDADIEMNRQHDTFKIQLGSKVLADERTAEAYFVKVMEIIDNLPFGNTKYIGRYRGFALRAQNVDGHGRLSLKVEGSHDYKIALTRSHPELSFRRVLDFFEDIRKDDGSEHTIYRIQRNFDDKVRKISDEISKIESKTHQLDEFDDEIRDLEKKIAEINSEMNSDLAA